jgi:hypothetical protein
MMRELDDKGKYYKNLQRINDEKAIVALSKFYGQKFELRIDPDRYYRDYDEEDLKVIKLMVEAMISDKLDYTTEWKPMILYVVNREDASNKVVEDPYLADEIKQKFDGFLEKDPGLSHEVEIAIDYGYFGEWPIKE